eukprot:jgi/Galph1/247/GphlegSOOS_G4942.1
MIKQGWKNLQVLKECPIELWIIYILKFLSSFSYFSYSLILTLFLSDEYNFSDERAGWTYGAYGFMSTVFGMSLGWLVDYLGVRYALLLGAVIGTLARLALAWSYSSVWTVFILYTALPLSESLGIPIMTIAIKRYTNSNTRTIAYSLFYTFMNLAALISGPIVDGCRHLFVNGATLFGHSFTSLRVVILCGSFASFLIALIVWFSVREIQVTETGSLIQHEPIGRLSFDQTIQVLKESTFWRLALMMFLLVGVRMVFRHVDATLPKYMIREFGQDAPFGAFYAINPLLVIILVPLVGIYSKGKESFPMILYGSLISGASVFMLCIGPFYICIAGFLILLSIGEAIYSPRVYEYTMQMSPQGREGLYTSLATIPLFGVVLITGGMSGYLLQRYCSSLSVVRHCQWMWAIIGIVSFSSPLLLFLFRHVISPPSLVLATQSEEYVPLEGSHSLEEEYDVKVALTMGNRRH